MALSEQELQHIAVADVERQVAGVEAVYKALMSQVTDSPYCHQYALAERFCMTLA